MVRHDDKGNRFVASLDAARSNAQWDQVPELVKKVKRYASERKHLVDIATAEHYIATTEIEKSGSADGPSTPVEALSSTLQASSCDNEEDAVQGEVCLAWAKWIGMTKDEKSSLDAPNILDSMQKLRGKEVSTWTKICVMKGAYISGTVLIRQQRMLEAKNVFTIAVDLIQENRELVVATPQLAYWSEQLLAQLALLTLDTEVEQPTAANAVRLQVFRHWLALASRSGEISASSYKNSTEHLTRMSIWRHYYQQLSIVLDNSSNEQALEGLGDKSQLAVELKKVEGLYENELMRMCKFPKATDTNAEIETWVEQVIRNWRVLCSSEWHDSELGEGGRDAISRSVLDILYRAATKTFHSTLILRRLFQVHKSLAEFDLAYRCLDTYIELVERAKARAAKSTLPDPGVESTESFLTTLSEAIEGLCTFGRQAEARKAHDLCLKLVHWLDVMGIHQNPETNGETANGSLDRYSRTSISSAALETLYRSLGAGMAHWARWTPYSEHRTQLQEKAVHYLRKASSQQAEDDIQVETQYALALVLAETRQIDEAILHVKLALSSNAQSPMELLDWSTERRSISLWHLLTLLLSSRQDFDLATESCTAAFKQFPPNALLSTNSTNLPDISEKYHNRTGLALVSDMECGELQRIIELRITELALIELRDGPEEAVNRSHELLAMFHQLFAHLDLDQSLAQLDPPKTKADTIKSHRGSIFGRKKNRMSAISVADHAKDAASITAETTRPSTQATHAPTIQVTDEHGKHPRGKHHHIRDSLERRLPHRSSLDAPRKLVRKSSQRTTQNRSQTDLATDNPPAVEPEHSHEAKQELPQVAHNLATHDALPPPASHGRQPPQQDVRLPNVHAHTSSTSPIARFPKAAAQRHALTILARIWLLVATLYRRANMFDDSKEASEEAGKIATQIEKLVSTVEQSARALARSDWMDGGKSVDEVWADVYCERAQLQLAIHQRRQVDGHALDGNDLRKAVEQYEQCLMFSPDHIAGVIGLSNILLDYYEKRVELVNAEVASKPKARDREKIITSSVTSLNLNDMQTADAIPGSFEIPPPNGTISSVRPSARPSVSALEDPRSRADDILRKTPENLNRIAARDRAYGLLSACTKLGAGWDNSEAWFALARAHELGDEVEKAKSVLWWCIELEDTKPIRHWRNLGYSLQ